VQLSLQVFETRYIFSLDVV